MEFLSYPVDSRKININKDTSRYTDMLENYLFHDAISPTILERIINKLPYKEKEKLITALFYILDAPILAPSDKVINILTLLLESDIDHHFLLNPKELEPGYSLEYYRKEYIPKVYEIIYNKIKLLLVEFT